MLVNVFNSDGKMKNIVTCPFHAAQFDTTNGKKVENLRRTILIDICWKLQNPILYQRMIKKNTMWNIHGNKVKVFCLLVEKRIC